MAVKYHYNKFPPTLDLNKELNDLVLEARTELGRYDGFLLSMTNRDILLSPLFTQEAVLSSRIEGSQNDWSSWCAFFIQGIVEQARDNLQRAQKIVSFYHELKNHIPKISKSAYGITALDFIFKHPYFSSSYFYQHSEVPTTISKRLLDIFVKNNILECIKGLGRKPNFYIFKKLIDIADGK